MTDDDRLRLIALDSEDLAVLSAHVQDAVLKVGEMSWLAEEKRFVLAMNRFAWEHAVKGSRRRRDYQRRRAALHFERVEAVKFSGFDRDAREKVVELLAIRFEPRESPSGDVLLDFAGGAGIRLSVECLEAQLTDLGPAWSTPLLPRHAVA
ncbi:MAG TPA: DUF2948 family protein [Propylenella sp.]|nr:DUF2948 family protein [Propylenella sp.]